MSNVFKYPAHQYHSYINTDDSILLGAISRAHNYLNSVSTQAYGAAYKGSVTPFIGLTGDNRVPEKALEYVSKYRAYYGVASGLGLDGYPTYESVYKMPAIECYFHYIEFNFTDAYPNATTGTLTLDCRRDPAVSHVGTSGIPGFTATDTHGLGNATTKYSDSYSLEFAFYSFDTTVAGEWGNYLNYADNGNTNFFLKVIDAQSVEVYTDSSYTTPVNIGPSGLNWTAWTSGGGSSIRNVGGNNAYLYQCLYVETIDNSNKTYTWYDSDYYSGAGSAVNDEFGANIVGARPSYYVRMTNSNTTFDVNEPVDNASHVDYQFDSDFNPAITFTLSGDGSPLTSVGNNGTITGATLDYEFCGLMRYGATSATPYDDNRYALLLPAVKESDASPSYGTFTVSAITNASPAVVTFTTSAADQTSYDQFAIKVFTGIVGMVNASVINTDVNKDLNGATFYAKGISHNQIELYHDLAFTDPVDTTTWSAYSSGGNMQDYDDNNFRQATVFGATYLGRDVSGEYQNFAPLPLDFENVGSGDQLWPTVVSPAKMNVTLIHPTRKSYGQDLTRYTNSTGAFGYRLSLTYNNISTENWRKFDSFIKQMRGSGAPFLFYYGAPDDGNGYQLFTTSSDTVNVWTSGSAPRLAKPVVAGDSAVFFTGFQPDLAPGAANGIVCRDGDVFAGLLTYRSTYTLNNVAYAGGQFETNQFGEAIIRFTAPAKGALDVLSQAIAPFTGYTYATCMLTDDDVEFDFHPTGNFVSFKVDMDLV